MSQIRSKNTKPELIVRKYLFANGFRYKLHNKDLPGKPDIVLPKYRAVIFVHGCFWHGHEGCKYYVIPKTRTSWWVDKIEKTRKRDKDSIVKLEENGWKVFVIWECEIKSDQQKLNINKINKLIKSNGKSKRGKG